MGAGLARRGFSVCLIPSQQLGELPPHNPLPLELPEKLGKKRLDDLLFKVGFFKLDESGLVQADKKVQVILKKHRLQFDGNMERWEKEIYREFPSIADDYVSLKRQVKTSSQAAVGGRSIQKILELTDRDDEFKRMIELEVSKGRPLAEESEPEEKSLRLRDWMASWKNEDSKVYRISPELGQPFNQFLVEHARRWGVHVLDLPIQLKAKWSEFQLLPEVKSKSLIINSLAGANLLSKVLPKLYQQQVTHWLFFDRVNCRLEDIPEPMEEIGYLASDLNGSPLTRPRLFYVYRDKLRDTATITLATWLEFKNSGLWVQEIESSRLALQKLLPFLPETAFSSLPSMLELNEMQGECMRRGDTERLCFKSYSQGNLGKIMTSLREKMGMRKKARGELSRRIFFATAHIMPELSRRRALEDCLRFLDVQQNKVNTAR